MALSTIGTNSIADSAVTAAKTSGVNPVSEVDSWRVTTNFANSSNGSSELVSANWERADTDFDKFGTGLSESSGIFTFPSTGLYLVNCIASYYPNGANSGVELQIRVTTNNSTYLTRAIALSGAAGADRPEAISANMCIDCTNTTNTKFAIYTAGTTASNFWRAATDRQQLGFTCIRLGDT